MALTLFIQSFYNLFLKRKVQKISAGFPFFQFYSKEKFFVFLFWF